jgi:hypothetical protein
LYRTRSPSFRHALLLNRGQLGAALLGVIAEGGVRDRDGGGGVGDAQEVGASHHDVEFVIGEAGVDAVGDTAKAGDGSMLERGRKRHAGRAAERGRTHSDAGAIGSFLGEA